MKTTRKPKVPLNQATRNRLLDEAVDDYAIHTLDSAGRIASWSAGAARLFGHDASEILGRDYACFHTRKDRDAGVPQQALRQADAEGRFETEGWRVRSNGKRFWAQVVIDAIRDSQGQLLGFAQLIHDLSEGRAAKEALRRSQEQFRLLVQSVTDYAIYMLDHRGRITNWNLGAQRIKGYLPEEVIGRHFSCFYTPEDREAGEPARGLTDANQLELSIINLATNARDAMPNGGRIVFSASNQRVPADNPHRLAPGNYICLSISDTGSGMDEETLRRAVEPFYTTKGVGRGTGLGLSIVDGLAEQLGGRLTLESQPGVGTTANIWIPAVPRTPESARTGNGATPQAPSESERVRLSCRVLVVDDDPLVLNNTAAMLEDLGCSVLKADSGSLALEILTATPELDILLTDQAMPRMNGSQLVERVMAQGRPLKMALATGFAEKIEGAAAQLPKLAKPFGQEELYLFLTGTLKAG